MELPRYVCDMIKNCYWCSLSNKYIRSCLITIIDIVVVINGITLLLCNFFKIHFLTIAKNENNEKSHIEGIAGVSVFHSFPLF